MHHVAGTSTTYQTKVQALTFTCIKIPQLFIYDILTGGWMLWNVCFLAWEGHHFLRMLLPYAGHRAKADLNSEWARQLCLWEYMKFLRKNFGVKIIQAWISVLSAYLSDLRVVTCTNICWLLHVHVPRPSVNNTCPSIDSWWAICDKISLAQ